MSEGIKARQATLPEILMDAHPTHWAEMPEGPELAKDTAG
jgi:hypothetical protein